MTLVIEDFTSERLVQPLGRSCPLASRWRREKAPVRTDPFDLVTLIATVAVLVTVALIASVVPTRRATRLEPTIALRIE